MGGGGGAWRKVGEVIKRMKPWSKARILPMGGGAPGALLFCGGMHKLSSVH